MKKYIYILAISLFMLCTFSTVTASADTIIENEDTSYDRYIAFGQDLTKEQKNTVMKSFGITTEDLENYKIIYITNEEEHKYLGDYIASNVIGKRALSSVMIVKTKSGSGIDVTTDNINYCTSGMYCNALVTAGLEDASVRVAGPFSISGTSALVGAMKAYSVMTGDDISDTTMDTATDELVSTADLADTLGDTEKAEELIAAVKTRIFDEGLSSEADIRDALDASANSLGIDLTEEQRDKITDLMMKISKEDISVDTIKEQAGEIYDKLKDAGIDFSNVDTEGLSDKVGNVFSNIFTSIKNFFTGLFG